MEQTGGLDAGRFVEKWSKAALSERAASHEHFIDLCRLLGVETPAGADGAGEDYCFEKHVQVVGPAVFRPAEDGQAVIRGGVCIEGIWSAR